MLKNNEDIIAKLYYGIAMGNLLEPGLKEKEPPPAGLSDFYSDYIEPRR